MESEGRPADPAQRMHHGGKKINHFPAVRFLMETAIPLFKPFCAIGSEIERIFVKVEFYEA